MGIRIGMIEYERPRHPIKADDIRQLLAVGGKDVLRMAWTSLNPNRDNYIAVDALAVWLCEFFNMEREAGNGNACIKVLEGMGLLSRWNEAVKPLFDL